MPNDGEGFLARLIAHYDAGRVNRSSMSKIFDAEGFSEEYKSEILGRKPKILVSGKFELFGFLIILSAWLIILGVWFFSELADVEEPTNIFWFIFAFVVISILLHHFLYNEGEKNEKILEIQLIFAFMIFINSFFFTSELWEGNRGGSGSTFRGIVNAGLSLTIVLGYHYMAQKYELNFSKILVGLGYFLPFFGLIWYNLGREETFVFHAMLISVILGMHALILSNFHSTYKSWYSRIQTFLIHLNLCWVLWMLPFILIGYFDSEYARFLAIMSILVFYTGFSIFMDDKSTELSKLNASYLAMIPYLLSFSLLPGIASFIFFGEILDILEDDNFEFFLIPPMLFIYALAAYHAQSNPFSTKLDKEEWGKRWFNRVVLTILIIYMIVFLIILLEEYVFYVFIPAGIIIAGTVVAKVIKSSN